jgi:hypothetical protein
LALSIGVAVALSGCGSKEPAPAAPATPPAATTQTASDAAAQQAAAQPPQPLQATTTPSTPGAMEELLAPVALCPDQVLGEVLVASTNPQEVLDAVQRLRKQAESVGNLKSSPQMQVANEVQDGKEVVVLKPASDGVVYVPQYDPVAVYAPPPATAVAPATTATTTGHSTGALVATGLLSFGAGILVANIFDDDDDDWYRKGYYYPRYGNGYYPSSGYNRPPGYGGRNGINHVNNGNIVINTGGNSYWDHYDNHPRVGLGDHPVHEVARPG